MGIKDFASSAFGKLRGTDTPDEETGDFSSYDVGGWNDCESCGRDMSGSELTDAWEDGDNASAYVTCRHCGHHNDREFG